MFQLKSYQQRAVDCLSGFLANCQQLDSVEAAYAASLEAQGMPALAYSDCGFSQVPYVCLRIPTGGGKTVLGSHAIEIAARQYLQTDTPIALWLVPTTTIRQQTAEALKTPNHPYRAKLDAAFNHQVLVLDIEEVTQIRPQDIGNKTIVIVATLASLRVDKTANRKVYAYHEDFEPHFAKLTPAHPAYELLETVGEGDIKENGLSTKELGKIKYSFANLMALHRPVVIVDEAHNARTPLTFETLERIHPAAIIELTATPNTSKKNGSNVLFHVSAAELKVEEMIKLPIVLTEHQNWQDAIQDAVITRNKLALDAQKDTSYIRPIALFQAEDKRGEVTVEVLKQHLIKDLNIDESKIAIATGNQRELDGLDLFDPQCPIEYIITIEALKEGWDCSFAYVFCSVKQVSSAKDAEQLLGRVLRMPYARRRVIEDLNRAYAHLATRKFSRAAQDLTDKLIAMGFEEMEIATILKEQAPTVGQNDLFAEGDAPPTPQPPPAIVVELVDDLDLSLLSEDEQKQLAMTEHEGVNIVRVTGEVSDNLVKTLEKSLASKKAKDKLKQDIRIHNMAIEADKAPSERGELFGALPQLCIHFEDETELAEPELFLHAHSWNLLDYPAQLANFRLEESTNSFSIDIDGKQISYAVAHEQETIAFNSGFIDVTEQDLIRWLDIKLRSKYILQNQLVPYLAKLVKNLLQDPQLSLTALVRNKFPLSRAIASTIQLHVNKAQKAGYQSCLFGNDSNACLSDTFTYSFKHDYYPSRPPYYMGRFKFKKHFFPQNLIEDLKATGEEYECAKAIDGLPEVKHWVRNLVKRDHASFWLPLAHNKFYPDFICELNDGRMLVVEYKGEAYVTNDESAAKKAVGNKWAELGGDKYLFIMAVEQDEQGRDVREQLRSLIGHNK